MMDNELTLPPGIGPHEGRELELMLAGSKPMTISSSCPEKNRRIEEALVMSRNLHGGTVKDHNAGSARVGELLGYSCQEISAFLTYT
ncbi:hypothetical protein ACTU44_17160 [Thalassospira sp. SM2505]